MQTLKLIVILVLVSATMMSCAARKKRKCNTCPKWSQVTPVQNGDIPAHDIG